MKNRLYKSRRIVAVVALLSLGLHSLIPVGYMPDFSGRGMLVVCDGIHHHMPSGEHSGNGQGHDSVCPFSVSAIYGFGGITAPVVTPSAYVVSTVVLPALSQYAQAPIFSTTTPRAPPLFS